MDNHNNHFNYRLIIRKLNYLEKGSRNDIAYITHQFAPFTSNPKIEHADAIKRIGRYIKGTREKDLIMEPDDNKGIEVYVDAGFSGS